MRARPLTTQPYSYRVERFNPRAREGATAICWFSLDLDRGFNPRAREGATIFVVNAEFHVRSFNPRAREGATRRRPTRGVYAFGVSIHAPVRARRSNRRSVSSFSSRFNPRAREGATRRHFPSLQRTRLVSIHAPVRARRSPVSNHNDPACFNPRAREGATSENARLKSKVRMFQSTRP